MALTVKQEFNIDTNWNEHHATDPQKALDRKEASMFKAKAIAGSLHNPEMGVHAEAYESLCGWAVSVIHNTITHGDVQHAGQ